MVQSTIGLTVALGLLGGWNSAFMEGLEAPQTLGI